MLVKQIHSFRATQSIDTVNTWKENGISVKEDPRKQSDGKIKTFFERPNVEIEIEVAELSDLMESEAGQGILKALLLNLAQNVMAPYVADNKKAEEYPDLTDTDVLAKALVEKEKAVKLTATAEEMTVASDLFLQSSSLSFKSFFLYHNNNNKP